MVAPVVGPVNRSFRSQMYASDQSRYRQKRPYNLALPYASNYSRVTKFSYSGSPAYALAERGLLLESRAGLAISQASSIAYERLKSSISDRASMGENLAQLPSTVRLLAERSQQVFTTLKQLKRGNLSAFGQWFTKGTVKRNSKFAADLTLQMNFVIKPCIDDVYACCNVLNNPLKDGHVRARAHQGFNVQTGNPAAPWSRVDTDIGVAYVQYGTKVAISNPNLYLLNTLGLINPAVIAWQLLPGSFLVDWFIPVEQFLGMSTDFFGLTLKDPYTTVICKGVHYDFWTVYGWNGTCQVHSMRRTAGLVLPSLVFKPLKTPSLKRIANSIALGRQLFK